MSANLYYRPVMPDKKYDLPNTLKYVLGIEGTTSAIPRVFAQKDLEFLRGVLAASAGDTKDGAKTLIEKIKQYGAVEVWLEG